MKNVLAFLLVLVTLFSCQKEEMTLSPSQKEEGQLDKLYPQTWQLVKMTGQLPNSVVTGAAMPWQEFYIFQADGTFTKIRRKGNQELEAKGTYSLQTLTNGPCYVLTYEQENELIGNCIVEPMEYLSLQANNTLISGWWACDGPGLEYNRVIPFD